MTFVYATLITFCLMLTDSWFMIIVYVKFTDCRFETIIHAKLTDSLKDSRFATAIYSKLIDWTRRRAMLHSDLLLGDPLQCHAELDGPWLDPLLVFIPPFNKEYTIDCDASAPDISFKIDGKDYALTKADYSLDQSSRQCFFAFMGQDIPAPVGILIIMGDVFMRAHYCKFDVGQNRVGFAQIVTATQVTFTTSLSWRWSQESLDIGRSSLMMSR